MRRARARKGALKERSGEAKEKGILLGDAVVFLILLFKMFVMLWGC